MSHNCASSYKYRAADVGQYWLREQHDPEIGYIVILSGPGMSSFAFTSYRVAEANFMFDYLKKSPDICDAIMCRIQENASNAK